MFVKINMALKDDQDLIQNILSGQLPAFEQLVEKYQNMVFTLAFRVLQNHEDAEEVAQDVFVKVFNSLKNFQQKSNFKTWLYRIVYNESINRLRSRKKRIPLVDLNEKTTLHLFDPGSINDSNDEIQFIQKAIQNLPETERIILSLYYYEDISVKEIAKITELTETNVKTRLFRSRQKLYDELKEVWHHLKTQIYES
ncbi:MAG: RNA polymerase sigma factor [Saprospiraceae bacterium]|nr:RNA polymerase sigma factor [Saprospiraceae bacterium]